MATGKGKKTHRRKPQARPAQKPRDPLREVERLKAGNAGLLREMAAMKKGSKAQAKRLAALEKKMDTRAKREEILMAALGLKPQAKKGELGAIGNLHSSVLKVDETILSMGKRMENMLSALKNHREYLIRLNKKVYKVEPVKRIEMEIEIMSNTLSIMALSGFDINKSLFGEMKRVNKMLEKEDADLSKIHKRMATVKRKFDEEMERFDFESIFRKSDNIPGYR